MSCRTHTLDWPPGDVFDAVFEAALGLGFAVTQADPAGGHLTLDQPRLLSSTSRRLAVSVTDSGIGSTIVHVSWPPARTLPWPLPAEGRRAARLCRGAERVLAGYPPA